MGRSFHVFFPWGWLPEVPAIGQHVRIEGQPGAYVVLHVDLRRAAADLMSMTGSHEMEERVPFFAIEPVGTDSAPVKDKKAEDRHQKLRS